MEKRTGLVMVTRLAAVVVCGALIVVGFSSTAHADRKCEAALETLHAKFHDFMLQNRSYAKLLSTAAKEMKKSAKKHKGDSTQIQRFVNDREMSKKEAKKINKMFQKAELIHKKLEEIKRGTATLESKLEAANAAYLKTADACDAE